MLLFWLCGLYPVFTENYDLLTIFHKPLWILMHTVNKHLIIEIALHFGDIYDATVCQFLEFGIVDICTVSATISLWL